MTSSVTIPHEVHNDLIITKSLKHSWYKVAWNSY